MANATTAITTTTGAATTWVSRATAVTAFCGTTAAAAGWWVYSQVITNPLHTFYRKGALGLGWANIPQADICARMMGNKPEFSAAFYDSCDYMRDQCRLMIEREFESKDATIMTALYFTALTFGVLQLTCHCCFIRPLLRAVRIVPAPRRQRRDYTSDPEDDDDDETPAEIRRRSASCANVHQPAAAASGDRRA